MKWWSALAIGLVATLAPTSAAAQVETERAVEVTYDVGDFDADREDWPVTVVYVTGDLDEGEPFTVFLGDDDGELWSSTQEFRAPVTAVTVVPFVPVGAVTRAAVAQDLPTEAGGAPVEPLEPVEQTEDVVPPPTALPEVLGEEPIPPPEPSGDRGSITEVLGQGSGGGGGGVLALSMVLSVILVAIVFRTPLPAQSTQRWTK